MYVCMYWNWKLTKWEKKVQKCTKIIIKADFEENLSIWNIPRYMFKKCLLHFQYIPLSHSHQPHPAPHNISYFAQPIFRLIMQTDKMKNKIDKASCLFSFFKRTLIKTWLIYFIVSQFHPTCVITLHIQIALRCVLSVCVWL